MICNDNGPISEQIAYFDGYALEERLLEGVRFTVMRNGDKPVCMGVHPEDAHYMQKFSAEQKAEWNAEVERRVLDGDEMSYEDGSGDLYWVVEKAAHTDPAAVDGE